MDHLPVSENSNDELCDVEELKSVLRACELDSVSLKSIQKLYLKQRNQPQAYFSFPGTRGSMISLPPFQKWPIQMGWSFSTWLNLKPFNPAAGQQPYLYNFKTGKSGLGYSAYFTGDCLVITSIRVKGKGIQHCVPYEFPSDKWLHCAITYHNKWRASEIKVYINGQLSANIQMPWQVQTNEIYDKCYIGGSGPLTTSSNAATNLNEEINCFSGKMSAIYLFNEGLSPAQLCAIHRLGPSYMGQFKYCNEIHTNLPPQITKALYEEKLASSLFCLFTPIAVVSGTLCIQLAPFRSSTTVSAPNYFLSAPHAALLGQTKIVNNQPISSTLQSLGCSKSLLPLLDSFAIKGDSEACALIIGFLCDLLESSPHWFANDIVQNSGFVVVSCALASNAKVLLSEKILILFIELTRTLLVKSSTTSDSLLLKHLMDNILFNPSLWIYSDVGLQIKLYSYLATEFLNGTRQTSNKYTITNSSGSNAISNSSEIYNSTPESSYPMPPAHGFSGNSSSGIASNGHHEEAPKNGLSDRNFVVTDLLFGEVRRVSTVLQSLHALKYYYWVAEEKNINPKAKNLKLRPNHEELIQIRSYILTFTKGLILRTNTAPLDEIQGLLNYLSSCSHGENLLDVLDLLSALLNENPLLIVSALDQKQGIKVLYLLIGSNCEKVRIKALKLLALFLSHCSHKKKLNNMGPNNLFMLLCEKLRAYRPMSIEVYEALIDILLESNESRYDSPNSDVYSRKISKRRIENSVVIKVIATLIHEERIHYSRASDSLATPTVQQGNVDIRRIFINDLWNLVVCSKENRRVILQMSVWQHWLINLLDSTISDSQLVMDQILAIFRVLLYHAIRYEYGGWRVWIDTLAIIHTKVSYDEFCQQLNSDAIPSSSHHHFDEFKRDNLNSPLKQIEENEPKEAKQDDDCPMKSDSKQSNEDEIKADDGTVDHDSSENPKQPVVSSISERITRESSGIQMDVGNDDTAIDEPDSKLVEENKSVHEDDCEEIDEDLREESRDSVDLAPSRAYRKFNTKTLSNTSNESEITREGSESSITEVASHQSMTSIPLEEESPSDLTINLESGEKDAQLDEFKDDTNLIMNEAADRNTAEVEEKMSSVHHKMTQIASTSNSKVTATPAFRIPEFKWGSVLIKLLNDLIFSIECDLYYWRCQAKCINVDVLPFVPKSANSNQSSSSNNATNSSKSTTTSVSSSSANIESILQRPDNQIYIINIIHFISQLADNIIIGSGGLLPLLADATGGTKTTTSSPQTNSSSIAADSIKTCEGLTISQANSILYRLINMVDTVIFASTHVNLTELETDKNTTNGGILRQCLRLACTVTVKNCLVVRSLLNRISSMGIGGGFVISASDFPKDMFDSYQGCSLLSADGLFTNSSLSHEQSDLIANVEYSPNQTPNTSTMPSLLPFQSAPIKDPNKLLQQIDISRIQACIYHDLSTESRQSQFLALSSLYFISVLMVSKYRDIIEPKQKVHHNQRENISSKKDQSTITNTGSNTVSNVESNLLNFGKLTPNSPTSVTNSTNALTDMLTTKLENTLDTVCPLLKSIMCDFSAFLSRTLVGSHGQDLVNKEAERTFKRANTSPVELVMLLCSQEWQNTLQKNAGLAFIELINEGRVLSHGMKDHIVRVAMEAEFILSRLRADDVAKHEHFNLLSSETQSARMHEEILINSLICSATRRDYMIYSKFKESILNRKRSNYKLDIWEDDDRRKRRFVVDCWDDTHQLLYSSVSEPIQSSALKGNDNTNSSKCQDINDTKRIIELQQTIELGGIDGHFSPSGIDPTHDFSANELQNQSEIDKEDELASSSSGSSSEEDEDDDEQVRSPSHSPDSENENQRSVNNNNHNNNNDNNHHHHDYLENEFSNKMRKSLDLNAANKSSSQKEANSLNEINHELRNHSNTESVWDYDDCGSVNDFTGSVIFAAECSLIWNIYAIPGVFQITTHELYFEPKQNLSEAIDSLKKPSTDNDELPENTDCSLSMKSSGSQTRDSKSASNQQQNVQLRKLDLKVLRYCEFLTCNGKIYLNDIRAIFSRHYLLQPHALEIFLAQRTSIMFAFSDVDTVRRAVKYLPPVGVGIKYGIPQNRRASLMNPRQLFAASNMTQKWQKREIGNFQYLMFLNTIAGRSYQDLNQYPVFPWILTNYESEELDLNLPSNFRDLSKPVGALNNKRREEFIERYQSWDNPKVPAFHYGTHYSTAAFTLNWLCRLRGSFNSAYLALQDGKYEEGSRLFLSIGDSWVSSLVSGQQNVKELIPEFFYLPEMFHENLGLPEVEYPPWAKSAEQFVRMHRLALESELVSCQLHQWIDLIFGYKQRGPEAVSAVNSFYYLTYQGNVNLNMIRNSDLREAIETQIKHFGQTPSQLTSEPHPPRFSALHVSPTLFSSAVDELNKVIKFPFNTSIVHISPCISNYVAANIANGDTHDSPGSLPSQNNLNSPSSILTITSNNQYQTHKCLPSDHPGHPFVIDPMLEQSASLRRQLIDVDDVYSEISLKLLSASAAKSKPGNQDTLDEVSWPCAHYVVTLDGRYIIMGSFYDNSFRVFTTESGKLCQVIFGHRGPITCMSRSDGNASADFYVATGSQDCSLLLWTWNEKYSQIEGSGVSAVHNPLPKLTITGHQTAVLSVIICAELGLIISGSKNLILVHTTTSGENIFGIDVILPDILSRTVFNRRKQTQQPEIIQRPQVVDKQKALLEASMLGEDNGRQRTASATTTTAITTTGSEKQSQESHSRSPSVMSDVSERFSCLKALCNSDYYITNLQLARELAFIVCVALPPPRNKKLKCLEQQSSTETSTTATNSNSAPLLMTFNLKGNLMDSTTIGQAVNSPKLGDICIMQMTRDGEYLILNDSPTTIKIYKTFDLLPVYAYNTNDIPQTIADNQNRVRSLAILDHKYILAGLDNGKIIIYNADFKNLQH